MTYSVGWGHPLKIDIGLYHVHPFLATWDTVPILNGRLVDKTPVNTLDVEGAFDGYCGRGLARDCGGFSLSRGVR